ncbi:MAG: galactose oxidase-like domain-containing protein, partial [Ignavibacteria bacterium]
IKGNTFLNFSTVINSDYTHTVTAPSNGNILTPGYYMMFVLRPKSASSSGQLRIPSVARSVRLS